MYTKKDRRIEKMDACIYREKNGKNGIKVTTRMKLRLVSVCQMFQYREVLPHQFCRTVYTKKDRREEKTSIYGEKNATSLS